MKSFEDLIKDKQQSYIDIINFRRKNANQIKTSNLYHMYRLLVSREALLIKKIAGSDNRIETYFSIYYYLLWNGILSKDGYFAYEIDKEELMTNLIGVSIPLGKGVCYNIELNFIDILKELRPDIKSYSIGTNFKMDESFVSSANLINKESINSAIEQANHVETLIISNNNGQYEYFLYDPTNFRINKLKFYNNFFDEKFYDVRTTLLLDKFNTEESPQQILERIKNDIRILYRSTAISLPENQLIRIKKYGIDKCVSGDKHIKLFREDNVDLFKQISIERAKILSKKN